MEGNSKLPLEEGAQSQDGFRGKYLCRLGGGDMSEFISVCIVIFKVSCGEEQHRLKRLKEASNQSYKSIVDCLGGPAVIKE